MNTLLQGDAVATSTRPTTDLPPAQEWKNVLEEILPRQGEWSEEEYLVLTDHRNRLVEFTDGFLEVLPMPTDKHQAILGLLYLAFLSFVEPRGGKVRFSPLRLRIRPGKFREPDLLLLLSAVDSRRQNRFWDGADLALEIVSEDKPERDLVQKRGDYAEARVPEYWIVNPLTETITVLRLRECLRRSRHLPARAIGGIGVVGELLGCRHRRLRRGLTVIASVYQKGAGARVLGRKGPHRWVTPPPRPGPSRFLPAANFSHRVGTITKAPSASRCGTRTPASVFGLLR